MEKWTAKSPRCTRGLYYTTKVSIVLVQSRSICLTLHLEILDQIRGEDFDIEYCSKNSFRFMGNGMTDLEERGENLAFYVYK
jgi:hypothetical protein